MRIKRIIKNKKKNGKIFKKKIWQHDKQEPGEWKYIDSVRQKGFSFFF